MVDGMRMAQCVAMGFEYDTGMTDKAMFDGDRSAGMGSPQTLGLNWKHRKSDQN